MMKYQERVSEEWVDLFRDIEEALGEPPESDKAQALAERWTKLVEGFTGGDPQITQGLKNRYAPGELAGRFPSDHNAVQQQEGVGFHWQGDGRA